MNDMTITQVSTVLNAVVQQATGQSGITDISSPGQFVAVAQTALKNGRDPVINALSQQWSKTIFAGKGYSGKFKSLEMSLPRFGNAMRKLSPVAKAMTDDESHKWPIHYDSSKNPADGNGISVDQWKISKNDVIQTNFYGTAVYAQTFTTFKDAFDVAFTSAEEFSRFNAMNVTERANDRESFREAVARGMQANYIAAILDEGKNDRVVHLLSEYNDKTGLTLDAQSVYQPDNFAPFMRWVAARIKSIVRNMGERTQMYQTVLNGKPVLRHETPANLRVALYAPAMDEMETMVMSATFHDEYLKPLTYEAVNFWQSIETPDSIAVTPVYTDNTGAMKTGAATEQAGIFGLIHSKDGLGYSFVNNWNAMTPLNAAGGYWNDYYHGRLKTIQDMTEKAVVLLLD